MLFSYHICVPDPSKDGLDFQRHMSWFFFMFNDLRGEVIAHFVYIGWNC
jgi:hypothetical protein